MKKEIGTAKVILSRVCFLGYRLSGKGHPSSAKNPGTDLALAEMCFWLRFSQATETFDAHVIERQGGLDIDPPEAGQCQGLELCRQLVQEHGLSAHMADLRAIGFHIIEFSHIHPLLTGCDGAQRNIGVNTPAESHKAAKDFS